MPENRKVLTYLRIADEQIILCAANLSETAQVAMLDLTDWEGRVPTDLFGGSQFPPIGADAYPVTLTGHGFFWLELLSASGTKGPDDQPAQTANQPDLPPPDQPQPLRPLG